MTYTYKTKETHETGLIWQRMGRIIGIILSVCILLSVMLLVSCSKNDSADHSRATQDLINMVNENQELKDLLTEAIALAKETNPDKQTNPAQTLDEFYSFIDWASHCMPWNILQNQSHPLLYEQIDQSLDYFYYIIDQPLPELEGKGLYRNSLEYYEPIRSWLISIIKSWGAYLSTSESWNSAFYQKAYQDSRFGLDKGWYEDPSNWHSFNDFFSRKLASPGQRPIAEPDDNSVVVSPADAEPQGVWSIDGSSNLVSNNGVVIKSSVVYSIHDLLGEGSAYKDSFANGYLTHTFLDVEDYHRYHFPIGGTVKEMNIIAQDDAVGGITYWSPEKGKYLLNATVEGWQFIETRGYVIIQTDDYGLVALMPVGMSQVSSVNFEANVKVDSTFKKGDMLGYFLFGGSDFIMLFQQGAGFTLTAPTDGTSDYQHLYMGEEYGRLNH